MPDKPNVITVSYKGSRLTSTTLCFALQILFN